MDIMVEFIMYKEGDFPVDETNKMVGLPNGKILKKGDSIYSSYNKFIRIETQTSIMYTTGYIETISVTEPIKQIYNMLVPRKMQILESINQYELTSKFCIVINLTGNPEILLSQEFIELAAFLKAEIEFDTYLDFEKEIEILDE